MLQIPRNSGIFERIVERGKLKSFNLYLSDQTHSKEHRNSSPNDRDGPERTPRLVALRNYQLFLRGHRSAGAVASLPAEGL